MGEKKKNIYSLPGTPLKIYFPFNPVGNEGDKHMASHRKGILPIKIGHKKLRKVNRFSGFLAKSLSLSFGM